MNKDNLRSGFPLRAAALMDLNAMLRPQLASQTVANRGQCCWPASSPCRIFTRTPPEGFFPPGHGGELYGSVFLPLLINQNHRHKFFCGAGAGVDNSSVKKFLLS